MKTRCSDITRLRIAGYAVMHDDGTLSPRTMVAPKQNLWNSELRREHRLGNLAKTVVVARPRTLITYLLSPGCLYQHFHAWDDPVHQHGLRFLKLLEFGQLLLLRFGAYRQAIL
jgi:hypothetical protein